MGDEGPGLFGAITSVDRILDKVKGLFSSVNKKIKREKGAKWLKESQRIQDEFKKDDLTDEDRARLNREESNNTDGAFG